MGAAGVERPGVFPQSAYRAHCHGGRGALGTFVWARRQLRQSEDLAHREVAERDSTNSAGGAVMLCSLRQDILPKVRRSRPA
jgi:hypothetical protein